MDTAIKTNEPSKEEKFAKITIDKKEYKLSLHNNPYTGAQLKTIAGISPIEQFDLNLKSHGHRDDLVIEDTQKIDVADGMKFFSTKKEINFGGDTLLPEDEAFLKRLGFSFELKRVGAELFVVLKEVSLSDRYTPKIADILIKIPDGYPELALDMVWAFPKILYQNGQNPPNTECIEDYLGLSWQRWSRHMTAWRGGIDSLETFFVPILRELRS